MLNEKLSKQCCASSPSASSKTQLLSFYGVVTTRYLMGLGLISVIIVFVNLPLTVHPAVTNERITVYRHTIYYVLALKAC